MDDESKFGELDVYADYLQNEDLKQNLEKYISRPEGTDNLLIDNLSLIHDKLSTPDYEKLIRNTVKETRKRGGLTCLMVLAEDIGDLSMQEKDMLNTVDGVFKFESKYEQGERRDLLRIYKLRGVQEVEPREINVQIGKRLTLDASKKI